MLFTNYLTVNEQDTEWGLTIHTVGFQEVAPYSVYPPRDRNHTSKHMFNPEKGRILDEYQLIYIVDGSGTFESSSCTKKQIKAGDVFLLFPGEWHTYIPNKETGWKEYWIGFKGDNMDDRVQSGFFKKEQPVYNIGYNESITTLYSNAITIANEQKKHFQQLLAGIVNLIVGMTFSLHENRKSTNDNEQQIIDKARIFMQEKMETDLQMPEVAQHLNMSYSSFRHLFKKYTGLSPTQYFINLKIHLAKRMLQNSNTSIKEISYILNFETQEYFAKLFKKKTGMSPTEFRNA
jgi:AraC-like DNA-binding protein